MLGGVRGMSLQRGTARTPLTAFRPGALSSRLTSRIGGAGGLEKSRRERGGERQAASEGRRGRAGLRDTKVHGSLMKKIGELFGFDKSSMTITYYQRKVTRVRLRDCVTA